MNEPDSNSIKNKSRYIIDYLCNNIRFIMHPTTVYYNYECNLDHPSVVWNIEFDDEIFLLSNESFGGQSDDARQKIWTKNVRGSLCSEGAQGGFGENRHAFYNKASIPIEFEKDGETFALTISAPDYKKVTAVEKDIYKEFDEIRINAAKSIAEGKINIILNRLSNRKFTVLNITLNDDDMLFEKDAVDYFLSNNEYIIDMAIKEIFKAHIEFIKPIDKFYKLIHDNFNSLIKSGLNCLNILLAVINYELQYDIFNDENFLADYLTSRVKNNINYFNMFFDNGGANPGSEASSKENTKEKDLGSGICCISVHDKEEDFYEKGVKLVDISISLKNLIDAFDILNRIKFLTLINFGEQTAPA